ncbi:MAG: FecR domain-containing protein [Burkholderiales bacterium]|nr:FecR domain-containing protein [Burkholderiales bacterium]
MNMHTPFCVAGRWLTVLGFMLYAGFAMAAQVCRLPDAPQDSTSAVYAGKVFASHGYASAKLPGASVRLLTKGDPVCEGDTITTGEAALLQLNMADTGTLMVKQSSSLVIDTFSNPKAQDGSEHFLVSLVQGGLRAITGLIGKTNKQNYVIRTATATIGIRGTDHEVFFVPTGSVPAEHSAEAGTYNRVFSGGTLLKTAGGELALSANQIGFAPVSGAAPMLVKVLPSYLSSLNRGRTVASNTKAKAGAETPASASSAAASDAGAASADTSGPAPATAATATINNGPIAAVATTSIYVPITASSGGTIVNLTTPSSTPVITQGLAPDNTAYTATQSVLNATSTKGQFNLGAVVSSGQDPLIVLNPANGAPWVISSQQQTLAIDLEGASLQSFQKATVDSVTVEWGLYTGGVAITKDYPTGAALGVHHFAMSPGGATTPAVIQGLSGTATYDNLIGSTAPTSEDNKAGGALKSISVSVSLGANPGVTAYSLQVVDSQSRNWSGNFTGFASLGDFTNNKVSLSTSCSGSNCGAGSGVGRAAGVLVGNTGGGLVTSYTLVTSTGQSVMGVGVVGKH